MWLWYEYLLYYNSYSTSWSSLFLLTYRIVVFNHYRCNARTNLAATCWEGYYASQQLITGLPWTVRNSNISVTSWKRLKNRWQRFWVFPWRRSAVMSRARGPYPCMLSGSFFFWSQGWLWKIKEKKYAGTPRNAPKNSGKTVRHGSFKSEICVGLLTEQSVRASHRKTGVTRWKYVAPVRYLVICCNHGTDLNPAFLLNER